ncbi:hypothetical protein [Oricola sp.]|uniref:hypothetical protein n=1 Tax=Oricola sp. TaxID=1979950 RepID=UPI003BAA036C
MFTRFNRMRGRQVRRDARATALVAIAVLLVNLITIAGLGSTALAGGIHAMTPYAPLDWEQTAPQAAMSKTVDMAKPPARKAAAYVPAGRIALTSIMEQDARVFVERPADRGRDHALLVAIMTMALGAMIGLSLRMFRSLAHSVAEIERRRKFLR